MPFDSIDRQMATDFPDRLEYSRPGNRMIHKADIGRQGNRSFEQIMQRKRNFQQYNRGNIRYGRRSKR